MTECAISLQAAQLLAALGEPGALAAGEQRASEAKRALGHDAAAASSGGGAAAVAPALPLKGAVRMLGLRRQMSKRLDSAREILTIKAWASRAAAVALVRALGCAREAAALAAGDGAKPSAALRRAWVAASAVGAWTLLHEWPAPDARVAVDACTEEIRKAADHDGQRDADAASAAKAHALILPGLEPALFGDREAFVAQLHECLAHATKEAEGASGYAQKVRRRRAHALPRNPRGSGELKISLPRVRVRIKRAHTLPLNLTQSPSPSSLIDNPSPPRPSCRCTRRRRARTGAPSSRSRSTSRRPTWRRSRRARPPPRRAPSCCSRGRRRGRERRCRRRRRRAARR